MKIAIVEDSSYQRLVYEQIFDDSLFDVTYFVDGAQALEGISKGQFHLVISDLLIPIMEGDEVLRSLKKKGINVPYIFLTSNIQIKKKNECLDLGAFAFLEKPTKKSALLSLVDDVLNNSEMLNGFKSFNPFPFQYQSFKKLIIRGIKRAEEKLGKLTSSKVEKSESNLWFLPKDKIGELPIELEKKFETCFIRSSGFFDCLSLLYLEKDHFLRLQEKLLDESIKKVLNEQIQDDFLQEIASVSLVSFVSELSNYLEVNVEAIKGKSGLSSIGELMRSLLKEEDKFLVVSHTTYFLNGSKEKVDLLNIFTFEKLQSLYNFHNKVTQAID